MMQAYEFYTTADNGVIHIPNKYKKLIGPRFKVIILEDNAFVNETQITLEEIRQLRGIVRSDIDEEAELAKSREERYENFS